MASHDGRSGPRREVYLRQVVVGEVGGRGAVERHGTQARLGTCRRNDSDSLAHGDPCACDLPAPEHRIQLISRLQRKMRADVACGASQGATRRPSGGLHTVVGGLRWSRPPTRTRPGREHVTHARRLQGDDRHAPACPALAMTSPVPGGDFVYHAAASGLTLEYSTNWAAI